MTPDQRKFMEEHINVPDESKRRWAVALDDIVEAYEAACAGDDEEIET